MKRFVAWMLLGALCLSLVACGTSSDTSTESADAQTTESGDSTTLTTASGDQIQVTATEDYAIGGTYVCAADYSVWSFGGDILGVGYADEDGNLGSYVCQLAFYLTEEDADGNIYLVVEINNAQTEDTTYWYVTNIVNDDGDVIELKLTQPGDEDTFVILYTDDYYESLTSSGDAAE